MSLEDNRSNVDTEGSSRGFDLRLRQKIDWVVGVLPGSRHVVVSGAVGGGEGGNECKEGALSWMKRLRLRLM